MLLSTMIPMTILIIVLLVFFWHYTNEYNQLSNNLAVSSEYNANYRNSNNDMSFKDEVDMDIYYVTIGRKGKDGLPTEQVDKAISTVESLKKTTSKKESLRSLKYLTNYLENLKKRMNQLLEIKNYQERQEFVTNNTEILTTLFEKEMQNYIYQEATELVQIESQLAGNVRLTIITMCAAILVATAILLRRSFRLTYSITKPISEILHNIKKVGKGEYKTINAVSADSVEIQELDAGTRKMAGRIEGLLENVRKEQDAQHLTELQGCTAAGIHSVAGTDIFAERFGAVPQLVVCGGGHVAAAVVQPAKLLGLTVLAMDDREEYAQQLRLAGADRVLCLPFDKALAQVPDGAETYFVVVTRAHAFDVDCLKVILKKPAAYVGMMGSRGRAALVRRQLLEAGIDAERVEALYAPIGLSIGSQTAEEIALSILAQIVSIKNARPQTEGFSSALLEAMAQTDAAGQQAVLAVIAARHGSTPREIGAKMLVRTDGSIVGSVGGGIMEHRTILAAQEMLTGAAPAYQRLHFSADGKNDDAAIAACGGSMEIVLTRLQPGEEIK